MNILRTPNEQFINLPGYNYKPNYLEIPFENVKLRMHYLDEGDTNAKETVLLLHGQPSWSYLYRNVIPPLVKAGYRVIAPDLIGFGKSDKPSKISDFSYARAEEWLRIAMFDVLKLRNVTLYAQDWGGLLSLRIVAFHPEYFSRVMVANTALLTGDKNTNFTPDDGPRLLKVTLGSKIWKLFARYTPIFPIGKMAGKIASNAGLSKQEEAAYQAPFPENKYLAGPRAMPQQIPLSPDLPAAIRNREAWNLLATFDKPFRTAFSDEDFEIQMMPTADENIQKHIAGAKTQKHIRIANAGHFLQEDKPMAVAKGIIDFIDENQ